MIRTITVVDVRTGALIPLRDVVITGNTITYMGRSDSLTVEPAAVVDGAGKYLIPGLWDMLTHVLNRGRYAYSLPVYLANGVMGLRDMGSPPGHLANVKSWIAKDSTGLIPRLVTGVMVDGENPIRPRLSMTILTC